MWSRWPAPWHLAHDASATFGHRKSQAERTALGAEWPRCGGCVVASARTHARSWRGRTGQPEWGLKTAFTGHKGPAWILLCPFIQDSPTIYKRLANTHKKYRRRNGGGGYSSCHCAPCAKRQHKHCAAPDFPSCVQTMWFVQKTFIFLSHSACPRLAEQRTRAQGSRRSHGTICIAPIIPRKSLFTRLYCQPKNASICSNKGPSLTWSKGKEPSLKCTFHAVKERPLVTIAAWKGSAA